MRRPPACTSAIRRGLITVLAVACGALAACGSGGPTDRTETGTGPTTTEETVLGVTVTRPDIESAPPAVPVPVVDATTTTAAPTGTSRPTTTRAARPTATTAAPVTTTAAPPPPPRPNRVVGSYAGRAGTDHVRVELFSNGAVFDTRDLGSGGEFDFSGLPDNAYRVVITDTINDDDPNDGNDTSSQVISTTDSFGLTDGDTAYATCSPDADCSTRVQQG